MIYQMEYFIFSPLEQFEINVLFPLKISGLNFSITNSTFFLFFCSFILVLFLYFVSFQIKFIPNRWQSLLENLFKFVINMVKDAAGLKGEPFVPFIFILFLFILICNLIGLVPYTFTVTSHIVFTFSLALMVFVGITIIGIKTHGINFLNAFLPKGTPVFIIPLLVVIEFISYVIKVFTLSIRLFANMVSGHILLKIVVTFVWTMLSAGGLLAMFSCLPFMFLFVLLGLELGVAILQAYVFTLLSCVYLRDVIELH
uniref:ATP synthase F0 subunit 6 n=1 Tax=Glaucosphaera vacuolata TaxID=38265 RepID=UPI001FCD1C1D|nr:ATP synthase F0 subunit 6 [Glaucosphaera vacuolata]UNJ18762.1 ATP synthase F0 subunit 6 [Glaucosphaera vacuolata]